MTQEQARYDAMDSSTETNANGTPKRVPYVQAESEQRSIDNWRAKQATLLPTRVAFMSLFQVALSMLDNDDVRLHDDERTTLQSIKQLYVYNGEIVIERYGIDDLPITISLDTTTIDTYKRRELYRWMITNHKHQASELTFAGSAVGYVTKCINCNGLGSVTDDGTMGGTLHILRCAHQNGDNLPF